VVSIISAEPLPTGGVEVSVTVDYVARYCWPQEHHPVHSDRFVILNFASCARSWHDFATRRDWPDDSNEVYVRHLQAPQFTIGHMNVLNLCHQHLSFYLLASLVMKLASCPTLAPSFLLDLGHPNRAVIRSPSLLFKPNALFKVFFGNLWIPYGNG
jgi:hypothetical protein